MSAIIDPKVSVLIITYNHEKYIRQALDSVMMQKTDFPFEVIIADDCSQDATPEIIRDYRAEDTEIRLLLNDTNLGVTRTYKRGFDACRGEYIAVIEGDDFWISPRKLELLYTFLQEHPESPLCFHRIIRIEEGLDRSAVYPQLTLDKQFCFFTASDLARQNFIRNVSACMYRRKAIAVLDPRIWNMKVREWLFNIVVAQQGPIGYVPEILSVYRAHPSGVWSGKTITERSTEILELVDVYNEYLGFRFNAEFEEFKRPIQKNLKRARVARKLFGARVIPAYHRIRRQIKPFVPPIFIALIKAICERNSLFHRNG